MRQALHFALICPIQLFSKTISSRAQSTTVNRSRKAEILAKGSGTGETVKKGSKSRILIQSRKIRLIFNFLFKPFFFFALTVDCRKIVVSVAEAGNRQGDFLAARDRSGRDEDCGGHDVYDDRRPARRSRGARPVHPRDGEHAPPSSATHAILI